MEAALPWLRQGDVFQAVPNVLVEFSDDELTVMQPLGSAVLISENCQMDKRTRAGKPKLRILQFAPVRSTAALDPDIVRRLRNDEVSPPEIVYVGDLGEAGEGCFRLGEVYPLPAAALDTSVENFEGHRSADPADPWHAVARRHADRIGTMDPGGIDVMHRKMWAFWTKKQPGPPV